MIRRHAVLVLSLCVLVSTAAKAQENDTARLPNNCYNCNTCWDPQYHIDYYWGSGPYGPPQAPHLGGGGYCSNTGGCEIHALGCNLALRDGLLDSLESAIASRNPGAILATIEAVNVVVFNPERQSLQVIGCRGAVIANFRLRPEFVVALEVQLRARERMLTPAEVADVATK